MTDQDAGLSKDMARRNWVILTLMVAVSLVWQSAGVTLGVLGGGLVVTLNYHWMGHSLARLLADTRRTQQRKAWAGVNFLLRLLVMGMVIYLLLAQVQVHPVGLAVGLSVYVVNLVFTTLQRLY